MVTLSVRSYALLPNTPQGSGPGRRFELEVEEGTTLAQLTEQVLAIPEGYVVLAAVNGRVSDLEYVLQSQDRIDLFAPLVGG